MMNARMPPHDLDAERSLIGSVLIAPEVFDDVAHRVKSQHFYSAAHQDIWLAIGEMIERRAQVDCVTLAAHLAAQQRLDHVGGTDALIQIMETVPHAAHAAHYADIVIERATRRALTTCCTETLTECYESHRDTPDLLASAEQRLFSIAESDIETHAMDSESILCEAFDRINARINNSTGVVGVASGWQDLDQLTTGFRATELCIVAARPSMGKTALVCNIAEAAIRDNVPVVLFSLEQDRRELMERLLCIRSGVDGHHLRSGVLDEVEHRLIMEAAQELSTLPLWIDDASSRSMVQIAAICRRQKRRKGLGLVVIDYLQLIEPEDKRAPREQQIALISRRLKCLAKDLDVPVIALAQLNRAVDTREDKRPRLADLRESGSIEQDADVVMFLHRPEVYDPEDRPGEADLIVAKNRNGPTGTASLAWLSRSMQFRALAHEHQRTAAAVADQWQ